MGTLTINLSAITGNFKKIQGVAASNCAVAAVVKANAYGCGTAAVASALHKAGADKFFIATLTEGLELRTIVGKNPDIYMLNGFDPAHADLYTEENIRPVLNSVGEIEAYSKLASQKGEALPAILHIDTGMNRLGLEKQDVTMLADQSEKLGGIDVQYVMSHFACSDEKNHPMNESQYDVFREAVKAFPNVPQSLANSSGIFRSPDYHFDLVRPGMCLYGLNPTPETYNPMVSAVSLGVEVLQVKDAKAGETCGYNATHCFENNAKLAIVSMGYADGFLRELSNKGALYCKGHRCPVRGRVSMDLTIVDLSEVPENDLPKPGDMLEVLGEHQSADDIAADCGTIGYEIFTSLSRRYQRVYKD